MDFLYKSSILMGLASNQIYPIPIPFSRNGVLMSSYHDWGSSCRSIPHRWWQDLEPVGGRAVIFRSKELLHEARAEKTQGERWN